MRRLPDANQVPSPHLRSAPGQAHPCLRLSDLQAAVLERLRPPRLAGDITCEGGNLVPRVQSIPALNDRREIETMDSETPKPPDEPSARLSPDEEARRVIADYANDLREVIRQLRRKMH